MSPTAADILAHCRKHGLPVPANVLPSGPTPPTERPSPAGGTAVMPRHVAGRMNKTEAAYAARLDALKAGGSVAWWAFEPVKLRLCPPGDTGVRGVWYGVDFLVADAGGLFFDEVKGSWVTEDGLLKWRWAAQQYPGLRLRMWQKGRDGAWACVRQSDGTTEQRAAERQEGR